VQLTSENDQLKIDIKNITEKFNFEPLSPPKEMKRSSIDSVSPSVLSHAKDEENMMLYEAANDMADKYQEACFKISSLEKQLY
jgi:hypothetical protein